MHIIIKVFHLLCSKPEQCCASTPITDFGGLYCVRRKHHFGKHRIADCCSYENNQAPEGWE